MRKKKEPPGAVGAEKDSAQGRAPNSSKAGAKRRAAAKAEATRAAPNNSGGDAPGNDDPAEPHVDTGAKLVIELTETLLRHLHDETEEEFTNDTLRERLGFSESRFRALRYAESQGTLKITLEEIKTVIQLARELAGSCSDPALGKGILGICTQILAELHKTYLDLGELTSAEQSVIANLKIDPDDQMAFSDTYAGVYALLRFTRSGWLIVTRMDVRPKSPASAVCRFRTRRIVADPLRAEQVVDGYIYQVGHNVYAVGRPQGGGALRSTILVPVQLANDAGGPDLMGLRLSDSQLDGGLFGHRMYATRIAGPKDVESPLPSWEPLFRAYDDLEAATTKLEKKIKGVAAITTFLQAASKPGTAWGVSLPG